MKIKPNQLCFLVGLVEHSKMNGRVVQTVRYVGDHVGEDDTIVQDAWEVKSSWSKTTYYVSAKHLKPLHDPDLKLPAPPVERRVKA